MPNRSKIRDPRMWAKWRENCAVGTMSSALFAQEWENASLGTDYCLICDREIYNVKLGSWYRLCDNCQRD